MQWVHELASKMDPSNYARFTGLAKPKYVAVDAPLTPDVIERHLKSDPPIAAYVLSDRDENKGHVIVFDFDDHHGTSKRMEQVVAAFSTMLRRKQVPHSIVQSGGGNGYHIWLVFDAPKRKDVLRDNAKRLLAAFEFEGLTFTEGTKGIEQGQIEIFPKGDGAGGKSAIALPLARKSVLVRVKDTNGLLSLPHYGNEQELPLIRNARPGPKGRGGDKEPDRQAAFDAVISKRDPADYDDWVAVGRRLTAAFGVDDPWAKQAFVDWGLTAPGGQDSDGQAKKWKECATGTILSRATFWLDARDNDYSGPLPFSKTELDKHQVLDFAAGFPIFRSQDNETFACIAPRRFVLIRSREFEACIRRAALDRGRLLKAEDLNAAVKTLDAQALAEPKTEFALRFAAHDERRFLNLAGEDGTVIEIDAHGWRVCEEPPVRFLSGDGRELPMPVTNGTLEEFRRFVNVDDGNLPLLLAWMVSCFVRPGREAPIALLDGPAGSGKSTTLQIVVDMLDPKPGLRAGLPSSEDDLVVAALLSGVASFDNASTLNRLSDPLCRLATGGGLRKRTLYTDTGVTAIDVIRPVIIAGIDPVAHQQDLIERLLLIHLRIPEERLDDEALFDMVREARPRLLGWLLDLVVKVLAMPAPTGLEGVRMKGFAAVGERVAVALGHHPGWFMERYRAMLEEGAEEGAEGDCVFRLILLLLAQTDGRPLRSTSLELLDVLHRHIKGGEMNVSVKDVPNDPRAMSHRVNRIVEPLRRLKGVEHKRGREREWIFYPPQIASDEDMATVFASAAPPF